MRVPLNETSVITLNGSGNGTAKVGPLTARETWYPAIASVSAGLITNEAQCKIYVGDSYTLKFRDGCIDGSSGDSTEHVKGDVIKSGQYVWAIWSGGDANVSAQLTVTGEKEV